ncbi:MFS transporter [Pseudomonas cichorii]|uniref:MFS transporter n=1 Tax=Pseudomonas syringae group TaxID=136849 RepID=UPI001910C8F8|nr:MFS transporter [Pseudomonas cichorii]MBX8538804.1 MFS transporter [Pseudomonas cichorii]MBX8578903.1 MFS transporter [Pseudomonas cichorii]GFM64000.1 MFS transporter [Pseudomonas cichorii]
MTTQASALSFRQALLAMLGISLVLMLSALDQTVIGNALPSIVAELQGFELYAWVATGYLLTSIVTIPVFGRLGDYFGRKPFVIAATIVFTLASLICALATDMLVLVIGRALQGVGGGMLIGTAFACIPELFPDTRQRLRWQMMLSALFSVVNAIGPGLGGLLTEAYGWRSVFYLNLPLGCIALFFAWRYLPYYRPVQTTGIRLDWFGALLIALALGSLQLGVEWMGHSSTLLSASLALICLFSGVTLWYWERRCTSALLPPAMFAVSSMRTLFLLSVLAGAIMFSLLFYLPLLLQGSYGYSPKDAGLLITPLALSITLGAIVNSRIVTRLSNPNILPLAGFLALLLACAGLAVAGRSASFTTLLMLILLAGTGLGFILLNLTVFTQTLAERQFLGIATALIQSLRLVGGLLGTAAMGVLVNLLYVTHLNRAFLAAGHESSIARYLNPQVLLTSTSADSGEAWQLLELAREALARSVGIGLLMCAGLGVLGLLVLYRLPAVKLVTAPTLVAPQNNKT